MAKELAGIKQINDSLDQKKFEIKSQKIPINEEGGKRSDSFSVPLKDGVRRIDFIDLYFIAVEDHYCKFVFNNKGEIYKSMCDYL